MGSYMKIVNSILPSLSAVLLLEKSYSETCLPITASKAKLSRKKLEQFLSRYPKKWPFMDKVLVLFFPSLIKDVRKFHTKNGPNMKDLFQEHQLKTIDETLIRILEEYLRNGNLSISLGCKQVLYKEELEARWETAFSALKEYEKKHEDRNVSKISRRNKELYTWVWLQRQRYKREELSDDHIKRLEDIDFMWASPLKKMEEEVWEERWKEKFGALKEYKNKHGDCNVPTNWTDRKLVNWVETQRTKYRNRKLSEERIKLLEGIGFKWTAYV